MILTSHIWYSESWHSQKLNTQKVEPVPSSKHTCVWSTFILSVCLAINKRQSCSGNKIFSALIARAALAISAENSYCQSRSRLTVMCMWVRLAIILAKTCRHINYFRYIWRPGMVFISRFRRSSRGNCEKIDPQSCYGNKGENVVIARAEMDWRWYACASGWRYVLANTCRPSNYFRYI